MVPQPLVERDRTASIIGAFYQAYNELRFGFLESVYRIALAELLRERGHEVMREVPMPIYFRGKVIATQRLDMVVDHRWSSRSSRPRSSTPAQSASSSAI